MKGVRNGKRWLPWLLWSPGHPLPLMGHSLVPPTQAEFNMLPRVMLRNKASLKHRVARDSKGFRAFLVLETLQYATRIKVKTKSCRKTALLNTLNPNPKSRLLG